MWKLLTERDRKAVRSAEKARLNDLRSDSEKAAEGPELVVLTTQGIGGYVCSSCVHYGQAGSGPDPNQSCSQRGVPPDAMPCSFSPKRPENHFTPTPEIARSSRSSIASLDLSNSLILSTILPAHIAEQIKLEELKLPYRTGDKVSFVYEQTLISAEVLGFDEQAVHVEVNGTKLALPHATVIPPKRKTSVATENPINPPLSGQNVTEIQALPEPNAVG